MAFNVDASAGAYGPWTITLGGDDFAARDLSGDEVVLWIARIEETKGDLKAYRKVVRRLWRRLFPAFTWSDPLRWFRYVWRGDPVGRMLAQPWAVQDEALADFFGPRDLSRHRQRRIPTTPGSS